ncbi:unnamed protein product [Bursaphelenchus xylophilus]|uniref:(pine wood nematode) hypothetical protein n=1 Tax=Bursaphelenchus xylophilus TaxID=6326 RepID=A0A1I7SQC8_BURXY|nr:unnamed protein product [Bursaphelenchus xylophilus]CAG9109731.1 unnamed protein product [Bursaphelenchus xylophilus]
MGLHKKAVKWIDALGLSCDPCFYSFGDSAPLKELFAKLLSVEVLRTTDDLDLNDPIPFEKLLDIAQSKLGVHTCLVGADLAKNDATIKLGLFGTVIFLKSALKDFRPELISQLPTPDFGIAGGAYSNEAICLKCKKEVLFTERIVVGERVWHRRCMHCHLCGKRLFLGTFRVLGEKLECFEHYLNKELVGNELQSFENVNVAKPPPPRPPPPRRSIASTPSPLPDGSDKSSVPRKTPEPARRVSLQIPNKSPAVNKRLSVNQGSDLSADSNWEVVEYPQELNPFADEDEMSDCLNPFGYTSSDEDSDDEHPTPMPRKSIQSAIEEAINDDGDVSKKNSREESQEVPEPVPEPPKSAEPEDPKPTETKVYPDLRKLSVDNHTSANFYLPASLVLAKKRMITLSELDRPQLLHELEKVIKTLDYIERHTTTMERNLLKEIGKEGFRWDKCNLVDDWGRAMQQRHDNLIKGSMIVHDYLKKLMEAALKKITTLNEKKIEKEGLKKELESMLVVLEKNRISIPNILDENAKKENMTPKPAKEEKRKSKGLVKRIKKVF